jgi:hypothetical protein
MAQPVPGTALGVWEENRALVITVRILLTDNEGRRFHRNSSSFVSDRR